MKQMSRQTFELLLAFMLTLIAFAWLFTIADDFLRSILWTTLTLASWVIIFTIPTGALLSLWLSRTDLPGGRLWPLLCAALLILPTFVLISGWDAILGPIGWAKHWIPENWSIATVRWWLAVFLHSLLALPGVILVVSLGLSRSDAEIEDLGLLHWPWPLVLLFVSLRRACPLLLATALWIFVTVCSEIAVTDIYQIRTVAEEIYLSTGASATGVGDFPYQGILPFLMLTGVAAYLALTLSEGVLRNQAVLSHLTGRRFSLRALRWPSAFAVGSLFLLLLAAPVGSLIYKAGLHVQYDVDSRPFQTWSFEHTAGTLRRAPSEFGDVLYWTFLHATVAGAATLFVALTLSWAQRWQSRVQFANTLLIVVILAIPGPLVGIGLLKILGNSGSLGIFLRNRTLFAPVAASVIHSLPWMLLLIGHSFRTLTQAQIDICRLHGWGAVRTLLFVAIPQRWPIIALCFLFSFSLSTSEVATTLLVYPPGVELASVRMMGMLHSGVDNPLAGLALLLIGAFVLAILPVAWLFRILESPNFWR
jgi:iron(III) transport system permease protein